MKDESIRQVLINLPTSLLEAFDKTYKGDRKTAIERLMKQQIEGTGNQAPTDYPKLKSDAEDCRRTMDRLRKAISEKMAAMQVIADNAGELTAENVPIITVELSTYAIQPEDGFDRGDIEDYIDYIVLGLQR